MMTLDRLRKDRATAVEKLLARDRMIAPDLGANNKEPLQEALEAWR